MPNKELDDLRRQFTGILRHSAASFRSAALVVEQYAHIVESGGLPSAHEIAQIAAQLPSVHSTDDKKKGSKSDNSLFPPLSPLDEDDTKKRKRAPRKPRDPLAPKRPASAYILYQNQVRGTLKEKHPEWTNSELLQQVAKDWATLTEAQKKPFVDATALAKQEYDVAKAKYDAGQAAANGVGPSTVKSTPSVAEDSEIDDTKAVVTIVAAKPRKSKDAAKSVSPPKKEKKKKEKEPTPVVSSSSEEESDDDGDGDETEETEEPPKKKHKKEATPPPAKKPRKSAKEEKGSKKK